jgi:hypothetical protein
MLLICVESPFSGTSHDPLERARERQRNLRYLAWCIKHVYDCGHAAYAGHGLGTCAYPEDEQHRKHGLDSDLLARCRCDETWFFLDLGWSPGMRYSLNAFGKAEDRFAHLPPNDIEAFEHGEWPPGATVRWVPTELWKP